MQPHLLTICPLICWAVCQSLLVNSFLSLLATFSQIWQMASHNPQRVRQQPACQSACGHGQVSQWLQTSQGAGHPLHRPTSGRHAEDMALIHGKGWVRHLFYISMELVWLKWQRVCRFVSLSITFLLLDITSHFAGWTVPALCSTLS